MIVSVTLVFAVLPLATGDANLREDLIIIAVAIALASNVNLMIGYTGYVNFGNVVFYGLGGYIGLYLTTVRGWPLIRGSDCGRQLWSACLPCSFGISILRLRGAYFALATIGVLEGGEGIRLELQSMGTRCGLVCIHERLSTARRTQCARFGSPTYLVVAVMGISLLLSLSIKNSKFGLGLFAIREDEDAAVVLGVKCDGLQVVIYSISAFLPAVVGALIFFKNGMIDPGGAFDLSLSIEAIVMMLLGGRGTVTGAALGAALYEQLRGYLLTAPSLTNFHLVITGGLLLIIILFAPDGLIGGFYRLLPRARRVLE